MDVPNAGAMVANISKLIKLIIINKTSISQNFFQLLPSI